MTPIRVLVVDDHDLLRAGVRAVLESLEDILVCGDVASAEEALERIADLRPDVVLADISMKGMNGFQLLERVQRDFPGTRSIILSMHTEKDYAVRAFRLGASGYLVKDAAVREVELAIRAVMRGEAYLSPVISAHLVSDYARISQQSVGSEPSITPRQREVLKLIAEGLTTKAIAHRLRISVKTAETHRTQLMDRLKIHDVAGLVRYAIRHGLVTPDE